MDEFLGAADSSATIHESRESFTLHARRWLAALYCSVRLSHGDHAADAAAECRLRYFEDRVEEECDLPELEKQRLLSSPGTFTHRWGENYANDRCVCRGWHVFRRIFCALGHELTHALLRAEGVLKPGPFHLNNTAAFLHTMPSGSVWTAADDGARVVRVQVITPPSALSRVGQVQLTKEITELIAKFSGDASQETRTWVLLSEAAEGGWEIAGTAFGKTEFGELAAKAKAAAAGR